MSAKPTPLFAKCLLALCFFVLCTLGANAQVEPDTVKRKPSLPTGPPGSEKPVYTPKPKPQPEVQPKPPVQTQPQAEKPQDEEEQERFIDRLYFGGSLGLQFGSYTNISLLPILGYRLTDRLSAGVGAVYQYVKDGPYSMNNYGGRVFAQVEVVDIGDGALLAHAEAETLSLEYLYLNSSRTAILKDRKTLVMPMFGAGYRQRISDKASFDLLLLYNANNDPVNPYSNPVIRAGINLPFTR